jgi:uncharacterized membrane protein (UPF0127 family)
VLLAFMLAGATAILAPACLTGCTGGGCGRPPAPSGPLPTGTLVLHTAGGDQTLRVEIAETQVAQAYGLMNRRSLAAATGMAFLFRDPVDDGFWMRNTLIPLTIAFWDSSGKIVRILDMRPCHDDPCPTYSPGSAYVGAVEVNIGALQAMNVKVGDHVELER